MYLICDQIFKHYAYLNTSLFLFLSLDLKRIFILWPLLNFNLWISIVILDFNLYFILYFTVFYDLFCTALWSV